jgi:hypothetical protein
MRLERQADEALEQIRSKVYGVLGDPQDNIDALRYIQEEIDIMVEALQQGTIEGIMNMSADDQ